MKNKTLGASFYGYSKHMELFRSSWTGNLESHVWETGYAMYTSGRCNWGTCQRDRYYDPCLQYRDRDRVRVPGLHCYIDMGNVRTAEADFLSSRTAVIV